MVNSGKVFLTEGGILYRLMFNAANVA